MNSKWSPDRLKWNQQTELMAFILLQTDFNTKFSLLKMILKKGLLKAEKKLSLSPILCSAFRYIAIASEQAMFFLI